MDSHNRSFIGMTVHYINPLNVEHVSHTLLCRRFENSHTGELIAKTVAVVLKEFQIVDKMVDIVTDNAANMVKAFRILPDLCQSDTETEDCDVEMLSLSDIVNPEMIGDQDDELDDSPVVDLLLQHKRCANHTLNLVAAVDTFKARDNARYKRAYDSAMSKVQSLSNAVHRSTNNANIVEEIVGLMFLNPTCTRWSSSYAAVQRIVDVGIEKLQACQERMGQQPLTEDDMKF